jgi:hypothetical protein
MDPMAEHIRRIDADAYPPEYYEWAREEQAMKPTKSPLECARDGARRALWIEFAKAAMPFMEFDTFAKDAKAAFDYADAMLAELDRREKEVGK